MQAGEPIDIEALNGLRQKMKSGQPLILKDALGYDKLSGGELIHPTRRLPSHTLLFFIKAMKLALPVYLPVFSLPVLLFYPRSLIKKPLDTVQRVLSGVLRSSVFLAMYCTLGLGSMSALRSLGFTYNDVGSMAHLVFAMSGFLGGMMALLEKKSRRIELALFVFSKALEAQWNKLVMQKWIKPIRNGEVLIFMWAFGIVTHCYTRHQHMLRPTYTALLCKFLDTEKRHKFYTLPRIVSDQILSLRNSSTNLLQLNSRKNDNK